MFAPETLLSEEQFVLITDELAAPADFLLHRCLHSWLKDGASHKCILFSILGDFSRWKAIASKSVGPGTVTSTLTHALTFHPRASISTDG